MCLPGRQLIESCDFVLGVTDLYTFPPAPYAFVVEIFLREKGIADSAIRKYERFIDLPNLENRCDAIQDMNPSGTVPFFKMEDGSFINETVAMCEYIQDVLPVGPNLIGSTPQERATVRMWQHRMLEHYLLPAFYGHRNWTSSPDCEDGHFMKGFFRKCPWMFPPAWKEWLQ